MRTMSFKGILEDYINMLNPMVACDVSQKSFEDIVELCQKYSRSKSKARKGVRAITLASGGVTMESFRELQN